MPGQKQGESFVLKHRLAGAGVLIAFAVIILPMLLGGPRDEQSAGGEAAVSRDSNTKVFRSNITPIAGETPNAEKREGQLDRTVGELLEQDASPSAGGDQGSGQRAESEPAAAPKAEPEEPEKESQVAARSDEGGTSAPAASTQPEPRQIERGWIVQVGTFRKPGNVDKLVADLKQSGFGPSTTDIETSGGSATRVWVGPFETRVEAARVKNRVSRHTGSEALIVAYP